MLSRFGMLLALIAALLVSTGCSSAPEELWRVETRVEVQELDAIQYTETRTAGRLTLRLDQRLQVTETPSERLYLLFEETYSTFDLDMFSLVFFSVLGAIVTVGLYVLVALYVVDPADDENS